MTALEYNPRRSTMAESKEPVRVKLTPEQQKEVQKVTGKTAEALELSVEELEERIAPMKLV
jgi:hypothetical protein